MARRINKKCQQCSLLTAEEAIALHGEAGDNCWNPENVNGWGYDCHRRRSHYRHRADNNASRRRQRRTGNLTALSSTIESVTLTAPILLTGPAAVLVLYRQNKDAPVHAIAAEVWQGNQKITTIEAVHCMGMRGDKVTGYLKELLLSLQEQFGVSKFEDIVKEVPVHQCPIPNCPVKG